jgi:hypothetical protein
MLAIIAALSLGVSIGPHMVRPGMPFSVARVLVGNEKPTILNRTNDRIRAVEYPRTGITLTLDDEGRVCLVNGKGEETSAEQELERIVRVLPEGFKQSGFPALIQPGEKAGTDEQTTIFGYARIRVARMTSDTTAKITVSFYLARDNGEEEYGTAFLYLSWYRGWWTVTKYEGYVGAEQRKIRLIAYIDEVSGNRRKP